MWGRGVRLREKKEGAGTGLDAGRASRGEAGRAREELGCGERAEAGRGWQAESRAGPSGEVV